MADSADGTGAAQNADVSRQPVSNDADLVAEAQAELDAAHMKVEQAKADMAAAKEAVAEARGRLSAVKGA